MAQLKNYQIDALVNKIHQEWVKAQQSKRTAEVVRKEISVRMEEIAEDIKKKLTPAELDLVNIDSYLSTSRNYQLNASLSITKYKDSVLKKLVAEHDKLATEEGKINQYNNNIEARIRQEIILHDLSSNSAIDIEALTKAILKKL
tara:strand:- start:1660 stop:2094 length:435 start_codon:yes stop_codon:yes gene_type:complete